MEHSNTYVINFIKKNHVVAVKAGSERGTFLDIWMVVVKNRIFARSWGLREHCWYGVFLDDIYGEIRCKELTFKLKAIIPEDIEYINNDISDAYLKKYNCENNAVYAQEIIEPAYLNRIIEFVIP